MQRTFRVPRHASRDRSPADLEALAWLLDNSIPIPGTGRRIGVDALIGLVPGIGDLVSGGLALLVLARGAQLGVPRLVLVRMAVNVGLDFVIGAIPVVGDAFDAWYKANLRNVALVRAHAEGRDRPAAAHWAFFGALALIALLMLAGATWLVASLLGALFGADPAGVPLAARVN